MLVNGILRQLERYLSLVFVIFYVSDMKVNEKTVYFSRSVKLRISK